METSLFDSPYTTCMHTPLNKWPLDFALPSFAYLTVKGEQLFKRRPRLAPPFQNGIMPQQHGNDIEWQFSCVKEIIPVKITGL